MITYKGEPVTIERALTNKEIGGLGRTIMNLLNRISVVENVVIMPEEDCVHITTSYAEFLIEGEDIRKSWYCMYLGIGYDRKSLK